MLFSSIPFLYYFLPVVLGGYFLIPKSLRNAWLLLCSLFFYAWGEPVYVLLMIGSIVMFYSIGRFIGMCKEKKWKKIWLTVSVLLSVAMFSVFKYADFFITNFNAVTGLSVPLLHIALPIGISFYTFQCLSYVIDVYRGTVAVQKNFISFGAYVALFPQLIAGPIVRYVDISKEIDNRTTTMADVSDGFRRFLIGLGKKILLADQFAHLLDIYRGSAEQSVLFVWMYAISTSLYIYFDFSGYSDMAIGLGRVLGFHFIENFNFPFISKSVAEFWRRWHMSLGSWFRDYVYIPLGGNRVSKSRWVLNTLAVWMLTGLWHGASWNFVLWGLLFAVFLMIEKWVPALQKLPSILRRFYVLLIVVLSFVLFKAVDLPQAAGDIAAMFGFGGLPLVSGETWYYLRSYGLLFVIGIVGATPLVRDTCRKLWENRKLNGVMTVAEWLMMAVLLIVCTAYLVDGSFSAFLYFNF